MTLEEKLALSKKVTQIEKKGVQTLKQIEEHRNMPQYTFQNPQTSINATPYDPNEEMKKIKEGLPYDLSKCKLPKRILESIKQNPLNDLSSDPKFDAFTEKIASKVSPNLQKSIEIQKQLEEGVKKTKPINENLNTGFNFEDLKSLIQETIREEINSIKSNLLTESNNQPKMKAMLLSSDKFLFLDGDDNVYECILKYKGKNKKKS